MKNSKEFANLEFLPTTLKNFRSLWIMLVKNNYFEFNSNMNKKEIKLAENLNKLAQEKNLKISTIAYKVGMSQSTLHSYFNGVEPKSMIALKKVADFFNMTIDELIFGESSTDSFRDSKDVNKFDLSKYRFEIIIKEL